MLRGPRIPLIAALTSAVALALTGMLAYLVPVAHERDEVTLEGFQQLNRPRLTPVLDHIAHLADPAPYALLGLTLIAIAAIRRRPRVAAAILVLLVATGATTQTLKQLLAHPRYSEWLGEGQIAAASWPSGHATASMTLALCAILAVPARLRPAAAGVGASFAIAVSYAILSLGWHFPSDVVGGFLCAAMWTSAAVAALLAAEARWPTRARLDPTPPGAEALTGVVFGSAAAAATALVALARPEQLTRFAEDHTSFLAFAGGIAALATILAAGLARTVRT